MWWGTILTLLTFVSASLHMHETSNNSNNPLVNDTQCGKLTGLRTLGKKIFNLRTGLIITPLQS